MMQSGYTHTEWGIAMGKKLEVGGLRESSRIMLTEHKRGIRRDERET